MLGTRIELLACLQLWGRAGGGVGRVKVMTPGSWEAWGGAEGPVWACSGAVWCALVQNAAYLCVRCSWRVKSRLCKGCGAAAAFVGLDPCTLPMRHAAIAGDCNAFGTDSCKSRPE